MTGTNYNTGHRNADKDTDEDGSLAECCSFCKEKKTKDSFSFSSTGIVDMLTSPTVLHSQELFTETL